jgi:hypothetical protein
MDIDCRLSLSGNGLHMVVFSAKDTIILEAIFLMKSRGIAKIQGELWLI